MIKTFLLLGIMLSTFAHSAREPFPGGMIITEWDLAFTDMNALNNYYKVSSFKSTDLIINMVDNNVYDKWNKTERKNLTYCVSNDFGARKADVIEALKVATSDWMDVAGVKFKYLKQHDAKCSETNTSVVFDVRPVNFGMYLARAFFPNSKRAQRNIMIDDSSFKYSFVAISGFLRHELGHVLGFRHEHISADSNKSCKEDGIFKPLTTYDRVSVMHYPQCGGNNDIQNLVLSELDKEGVTRVYPF
jgi:hypothetical protein